MNRSLLKSFLSATLVLAPAMGALLAPAEAEASGEGVINGVVTHSTTKDPIEGALVILQCNCLEQPMETRTNARGVYRFADLPQGNYTIQVLLNKANISKVVQLPRAAKYRGNFQINPDNREKRVIVVDAGPVSSNPASKLKIDMTQAEKMPVGPDTSRDFTAVVDLSPTAVKDGAGWSIGGTTGAESKYTINGADVTSPAFGTVASSVIQEFLETVEVSESGYDAELGGASGGQVSARRISGTNTFRGQAGARFSPRFARPRFISSTDEALRVTQVDDFQTQIYASMSGKIIKDKLFFSFGISPTLQRSTLTQSFHSRVDRDMSGGFEECPYENGDKDCLPGKQYIGTKKFAEQKFPVAGGNFQAILGLDWVITPKHRLKFTGFGGPGFNRTSYRLPFTSDPNSFGTTQGTDPLGGTSRVATGVINDAFGTTMAYQTLASLEYEGRVLDDKIEIDAGVNFFQTYGEDAWRLDNPNMKKITATQEQDTQGRNLYEFLDRNNAVDLVPNVSEECNRADLPGIACPTRSWVSGGIGEYDKVTSRRVAGNLSLTHFFSTGKAGNHQLKYGGVVEWENQHSIYQYSGKNSSNSFSSDCASGKEGTEWCYNEGMDRYDINVSQRVDNHRYNIVDTDNPEQRFTRGFGRVRHEQGDLRAIASPLGQGIRANQYNESLSTMNYGVYLQDKWALLSNLYINGGVRWEIQDMRDIFGDRQILIWDNVSPRVGVVYDWTDEGKSRLYASYGWFYQPLPLILNNRVFGGLVQIGRTYRNSDCQGNVVINGQANPKSVDGQPTEYCTDTNSFTTGLTLGSVVPRLRGQYNQQFQMGYEQEVIEDLVLGVRWLHTDLGRAVEDVSTNGGLNFIIANPGEDVSTGDINSLQNKCDGLQTRLDGLDDDDEQQNVVARELQACTFQVDAYRKVNSLFNRPTRNYDAWTVDLKKRFAKNWLLLASYTYSRLIGNYDGTVDPITGAINIGASTQYDLPELVLNSYGPLATNQPHRGKIDGFYTFDLKEAGRLTLGTSFRVASGYPINIRADNTRYAGSFLIYVLPRGSGGRVEPNYQWNLSIGYAYPLPKDLEIEIGARLLNVTNAKAVIRVDEVYSYQFARPIAGGDLSDLKHAKIVSSQAPTEFFIRTILAPQGNYGVETRFQQPLAGQFEIKLRF